MSALLPAYSALRFIAEVSSNHNRDLGRALAFVDAAARCGCGAIKFQLFKVDSLFAREILERSPETRARSDWELPLDFLPPIAERCDARGIEFMCTPFYLDAVDELAPYVSAYKISSYELLWDDLLKRCAQTGKPVIMSTGMADLEETAHAVDILKQSGCDDLTLLHCVSSYPAPAEECHLAVIETLRSEFRCKVGWSDHSVDRAVVHRAIHRWGAEAVEFHFDLDEQGAEYGGGHCWLPGEIQTLIGEVRRGFVADGDALKQPSPSEEGERDWRADPVDGLRPLNHIRRDWKP